ncbi:MULTISPECIES: holo-ACP synthase [Cetobacterium]|jgi:holo-[acyl-carrier protein] synthase|uniref:Holo-[acyl-carrier-protein] synthase n=1 Tax=Candidatus Cetobacterium colombiensis TaxID=3073100 RepID=A0ABU4WCK7_9FUSO|nr:holo-ACP synthase [Candidatus Cetobacterium colombiensis]MDX8336306.1 holo-ACP synthase [Candidatus Cetobacterium colombiensis]
MKLVGIGNDIVEISRIAKAIEKNGFKEKVFTQNEIEQIEKKGNKSESYAGRFSAKEAISKALGTGVRGFKLVDIEILNDQLGKPEVFFKGSLKELKDKFMVEISISHCKEYATAVSIIMEREV